jgi:hypothetical protein
MLREKTGIDLALIKFISGWWMSQTVTYIHSKRSTVKGVHKISRIMTLYYEIISAIVVAHGVTFHIYIYIMIVTERQLEWQGLLGGSLPTGVQTPVPTQKIPLAMHASRWLHRQRCASGNAGLMICPGLLGPSGHVSEFGGFLARVIWSLPITKPWGWFFPSSVKFFFIYIMIKC